MWPGIKRDGIMEQAKAYATRFRRAAQHCGRTPGDIDLLFMKRVTAPWENDPQLRLQRTNMESRHIMNLQDNINLHIDEIAADATRYEALAFTKAVNQM